jgi:predicted Zn-dependent protease
VTPELDTLALAHRALRAAEGDEAEALVQAERSGFARFAAGEVHQPTLIENASLQLRVVRDGRVGYAATNRTDEEGLRALARRAGEAADSAPRDPHFPGLPGPAEPPEVAGHDEETASLPPDELARRAREVIAATGDLDAYGYVTAGLTALAVASTTGVSVEQRMTDLTALVLAAGPGASGYAEDTSWAAREVDHVGVAREATETARRTRDAAAFEAGTYPAVLAPYATAELLKELAYYGFGFGALGMLDERGFLAGRLGERILDPKISLADDALDPLGLPKAFDFEGMPKRRVDLFVDGVARGVVWDRVSASRAGNGGAASTGHAPPGWLRSYGPVPLSLELAPGDAASVDELCELVGDGVFVTRVHYVSNVEPREGVLTGTTRDGTFRIRGGRIAEPLVNLRFTLSLPDLLSEVPGLTRDRRLVNHSDFYDERYPVAALLPALAAARFVVTGTGAGPGI